MPKTSTPSAPGTARDSNNFIILKGGPAIEQAMTLGLKVDVHYNGQTKSKRLAAVEAQKLRTREGGFKEERLRGVFYGRLSPALGGLTARIDHATKPGIYTHDDKLILALPEYANAELCEMMLEAYLAGRTDLEDRSAKMLSELYEAVAKVNAEAVDEMTKRAETFRDCAARSKGEIGEAAMAGLRADTEKQRVCFAMDAAEQDGRAAAWSEASKWTDEMAGRLRRLLGRVFNNNTSAPMTERVRPDEG